MIGQRFGRQARAAARGAARAVLRGALALVLALAAVPGVAHADGDDPQRRAAASAAACVSGVLDAFGAQDAAALLASEACDPADGSGAWLAFDFARVAGAADDAARAAYLGRIGDYVSAAYAGEERGLDATASTTWSRTAIVAHAFGGDPTAIGATAEGAPANLLADGIYDWAFTENLGEQGSNAYLYALQALGVCGVAVPVGARYSERDILDALLSCQTADGSFSLTPGGQAGSADLTGMALPALALHRGEPGVDEAIEAALAFLSGAQQADGRFLAEGEPSSETSAMVIVGLSAVGVDAASDARFVKEGGSALDGLLSFQRADGTFSHVDGERADRVKLLPTEQALRALLAWLERSQGGDGNVCTSDVAIELGDASGGADAAVADVLDAVAVGRAAASFAVGAAAALVVVLVIWAVRKAASAARRR